jgi:hypothetical protein
VWSSTARDSRSGGWWLAGLERLGHGQFGKGPCSGWRGRKHPSYTRRTWRLRHGGLSLTARHLDVRGGWVPAPPRRGAGGVRQQGPPHRNGWTDWGRNEFGTGNAGRVDKIGSHGLRVSAEMVKVDLPRPANPRAFVSATDGRLKRSWSREWGGSGSPPSNGAAKGGTRWAIQIELGALRLRQRRFSPGSPPAEPVGGGDALRTGAGGAGRRSAFDLGERRETACDELQPRKSRRGARGWR